MPLRLLPLSLSLHIVLVIAEVVADLALQDRLQLPPVSCRSNPPSPVSCRPSLRARSTSIAINCSSEIVPSYAPADRSIPSEATGVSIIWRISLDQQIRRLLDTPVMHSQTVTAL